MKTYHEAKKWIWEGNDFPNFIYDNISLNTLHYKFGQLDMVEKFMNQEDTNQLQLEQLLNEALSTSAIEGGNTTAILCEIFYQ